LKADAAEKKNMITNPEYKEQIKTLWAQFEKMRSSKQTRK
jgi:hypothetical protein